MTQGSLDYLLTPTKEKIMILHLFKQQLCVIMLERMWEKKAKQPQPQLNLHTFVCLSTAIQMGPFKMKRFHSIPLS